jgi:hypothetical protein
MNLTGIIAVSGSPGLYKVVAQTRNGLLAESLSDGKRLPVYSTDKVSSLEDISIYGNSEDIPLKDVLKMMKDKLAGAEVPGSKADPKEMRSVFASCVPEYAEDRVYTSDMKKVFTWYALLDAKGLLDAEPETAEGEKPVEKTVSASKAVSKVKEAPKTSAPKASSKGMAKTSTVRKTGA